RESFCVESKHDSAGTEAPHSLAHEPGARATGPKAVPWLALRARMTVFRADVIQDPQAALVGEGERVGSCLGWEVAAVFHRRQLRPPLAGVVVQVALRRRALEGDLTEATHPTGPPQTAKARTGQ